MGPGGVQAVEDPGVEPGRRRGQLVERPLPPPLIGDEARLAKVGEVS